jgi:hypothetical protein
MAVEHHVGCDFWRRWGNDVADQRKAFFGSEDVFGESLYLKLVDVVIDTSHGLLEKAVL